MRRTALATGLLVLATSLCFSAVEITNVGVDGSLGFDIEGDLVAVRSSEARSGNTDLNGDGDTLDFVLQIYDASTGTLVNSGLEASGGLRMSGDSVAFSVYEARQGARDLNGDGDANDFVLHLYNAATGSVTNLGLATASFGLEGNLLVFSVLESSEGSTDFNGDGDARDGVLHVYEIASANLTNVGVDAAIGFDIEGNRIVFATSESNQGARDLNGDGDTSDAVLHLRDVATSTTTNLGQATLHLGFSMGASLAAFVVSENQQGNRDLNGDGDSLDNVLHVYDVASRSSANLGYAVKAFQIAGERVAFTVSETRNGGDANGDLDAFDDVLHLYENGSTANLAFAVEGFQMDGANLAFSVREFRQANTDLNGDGDTADLVLHLRDVVTGTTTNLATDATLGFELDGDMLLAFGASESMQGGGDGNGDGDASDYVLHLFDIATGTLINLGVDPSGGFQSFQLDGKFLSYGVQEFAQGATDLNGDGDASDVVLHYFDARTSVSENLGLDTTLGQRLANGRIAFLVTESRQAMTDLNGDGDALDVILHVADLEPEVVVETPADRIEALIEHVRSLRLPRGVERSRIVLLRLAACALERDQPHRAVRWLRAFQRSVRAQAGKHIDSDDAAALIQEANEIIDLIGDDGYPSSNNHRHHGHR